MNVPGIHVMLHLWLDKSENLSKSNAPAFERAIYIEVTCKPGVTTETYYTERQPPSTSSQDPKTAAAADDPSQMKLRLSSELENNRWVYTPLDGNVKNYNNMPLRISCTVPFSKAMKTERPEYCSSSYMLLDGVEVRYLFHSMHLQRWDEIHTQVVNSMRSFAIRGN